jgi:hypothetical protein
MTQRAKLHHALAGMREAVTTAITLPRWRARASPSRSARCSRGSISTATRRAQATYKLWKEGRDPETGKPIDPTQYVELGMNPGDNRDNIAADYLATLESLPEKQRRRFLEGEWLPDIEGALWTLDSIERNRIEVPSGATFDALLNCGAVPALKRVVAVDPSGASGREGERSDEIGTVVAGLGTDGGSSGRRGLSNVTLAVSTVTAPPTAMASRALMARFRITSSI